jgi:hypothetical protein
MCLRDQVHSELKEVNTTKQSRLPSDGEHTTNRKYTVATQPQTLLCSSMGSKHQIPSFFRSEKHKFSREIFFSANVDN